MRQAAHLDERVPRNQGVVPHLAQLCLCHRGKPHQLQHLRGRHHMIISNPEPLSTLLLSLMAARGKRLNNDKTNLRKEHR